MTSFCREGCGRSVVAGGSAPSRWGLRIIHLRFIHEISFSSAFGVGSPTRARDSVLPEEVAPSPKWTLAGGACKPEASGLC